MHVTDTHVDLGTPSGPMRCYLYEPAPGDRPPRTFPGLILYSEIFQQTDPIRRLAVQFASRGHVVLVPEVYHTDLPAGTVLAYDDDGKQRGNDLKYATPLAVFDNDARAAIRALAARPSCNGRLGTVGFCLGGHLSFRCALNREILAAACFFPTDIHSASLGKERRDDSLRRAGEIGAELMMVWGRQDPHIPAAGRRQIYAALDEAKRFFTWHEFNCAHAFMRDEGERYNPEVAHRCFDLALDLFRRNL
jgi:carboxymethylenebutenolidase